MPACLPRGAREPRPAVPEEVRAFLPGVRAVWPGMEELRRVRAGVCELRDREGRKIGSLLYETISDAERQFGYAGTIEVAILLDPEEKVAGVLIGKNRETPAFLNRVRARKFLESWNRLPGRRRARSGGRYRDRGDSEFECDPFRSPQACRRLCGSGLSGGG